MSEIEYEFYTELNVPFSSVRGKRLRCRERTLADNLTFFVLSKLTDSPSYSDLCSLQRRIRLTEMKSEVLLFVQILCRNPTHIRTHCPTASRVHQTGYQRSVMKPSPRETSRGGNHWCSACTVLVSLIGKSCMI